VSALDIIALSGLSTVIVGFVCVGYGRYQRAAVLRDWEAMLTAAGQRAIQRTQERMRLDALMVDHSYARAVAAVERQEAAEVRRLLESAAYVLTQATRDRVSRLRGMLVCARMAAAIMPVHPLPPLKFKLRRLVTLAGLGATLHYFLVTPLERFALRAYVTLIGLQLALRVATRATSRTDTATFGKARGDWGTLDEAHLESFRALLSSLAAEEKVAETYVVDL
jgi:hypothetical protein